MINQSGPSTVIKIRRRRRRGMQPPRNLLTLFREYDYQSRRDFITEGILFAAIVVVAIAWPAIHTLQLLAEIG